MAGTKLLFCFDFDHTIVNAHFNNALADRGVPSQGASVEIINDLITQFGVKNQSELKDCMQSILREGHALAITSFTMYPEVAKTTLKAVGLSAQEISQVKVVGGYPCDVPAYTNPLDSEPQFPSRLPGSVFKGNPEHEHRKEQHIGVAMKHFGIDDPTCVILIDDSAKNINKAKQNEHVGLLVPKQHNPQNKNYLSQAKQLASQYSLVAQQSQQHPSPVATAQSPRSQTRLDVSQARNLHQLAALIQSYPGKLNSSNGQFEISKQSIIDVINQYVTQPELLGAIDSREHTEWMQQSGVTSNYGILNKLVELGKRQHEDQKISTMIAGAQSLADLAVKIRNCPEVLRGSDGAIVNKTIVVQKIQSYLDNPAYMADLNAQRGAMRQEGVTTNYGLVDKIVELATAEYQQGLQQKSQGVRGKFSPAFQHAQQLNRSLPLPMQQQARVQQQPRTQQQTQEQRDTKILNNYISTILPREAALLNSEYLSNKKTAKIGGWAAELHGGGSERKKQIRSIMDAIDQFKTDVNDLGAVDKLLSALGRVQDNIGSKSSALHKVVESYKSDIKNAKDTLQEPSKENRNNMRT
tara:strand:+ start:34093 stop:35835 length:1743 start_codon:yes stop_codon:yes gene_type:complete